MAIKITEIEALEGNNELVREIISKNPSWAIRYGTTIFFLILIGLLILSYVIKYPDVITARCQLTTSSPPQKIVTKRSGDLVLLKNDMDFVEEGTPIGYIRSSTDYVQGFKLREVLKQPRENLIKSQDFLHLLRSTDQLGSYNSSVNDLVKSLDNYSFNKRMNPIGREIEVIQRQILKNQELLSQKKKQRRIVEKEYELISKDHSRNKHLFNQNVISEKDFDESTRVLLGSENSIESLSGEVINLEMNLISLEKTLVQFDNQFSNNNLVLVQSINNTFDNLKNTLNQWWDEMVLMSTFSGKLIFHKPMRNNQFIQANTHVLSVIRDKGYEIEAVAIISTVNSGKVKQNQNVHIMLDDYPYEEFGVIKGKVNNFSNLTVDDSYLVKISIDSSNLKTSYHMNLNYRSEMVGTAEIITDDLRLIERFFYQLRKLVSNTSNTSTPKKQTN